jgi:glycosyltransferase involved in cell wall biosynthesis
MRILLVTARYLPYSGGLETVVANLARELKQRGHSVRIVTNRIPRGLKSKEVIHGVDVHRLPFILPSLAFIREKRVMLFLLAPLVSIMALLALYRLVRAFKPDVINLHYVGAQAIFVLAIGWITRVPNVVSLHGGDVDGEPYQSSFKRWRFAKVLMRAHAITACSKWLANKALDLYPAGASKIRVIYNGVNLDLFRSAEPHRHDRPYIAAIGQLVPHKGFDLLIDAFSIASPGITGVHLLIAGDGEMRQALEGQVERLGLANSVHFLGACSEQKVASVIRGCEFVAMPSRREPFGIVALEAMAAGKSVLVGPVGGLEEFAASLPNRVVPLVVTEWAQAVMELLCARKNAADNAVAVKDLREFSWDRVCLNYIEVYRCAIDSVSP